MTNTRESFRYHETGEGGSDRAFGFVFSAVFLLFGVFSASSAPLLRGGAVVAGIAFGAVALAAPARLAPLNRLWMRLGMFFNRVVSPVMLGIIFYLAVTPTGLAMRLCGKDLLRRRFDRAARTYWIDRDPAGPSPESLNDQF